MAQKSIFSIVTLALNLLTLPSAARAADSPGSVASDTNAFRTHRLSTRQMRLWNSMRKIVLATDHRGRATHPVLYGLWHAVGQSGHRVFVELITDPKRCSNLAGETVIENYDPTGRNHSIRVRLFIPTIQRAYAGRQVPWEGLDFVPLAGLGHYARCVQVFGHELAHVERMLRDPEYLNLVRRVNAEQLAIAAAAAGSGRPVSNGTINERSNRIWHLVLEVEKPALAAEEEIYQELLAGK